MTRSLIFVFVALALAHSVAIVASVSAAIEAIGAGASFPSGAYKSLGFAFSQEAPPGFRISYASLTSTKGKCRLYQTCPPTDTASPPAVDWIAITSPLPPSDYVSYPDVHLYPSFAGAVVPVYNLGPGIRDLVLSKSVLARIFRQCAPGATCPPGSISHWNDTAIVTLNPHIPQSTLDAAGQISLVVWSDRAGTTETFKKSLALFESGIATQLAGQLNDGTVWTNVSCIKANTNQGVSSRVLAILGAIGYVSLDEAQASDLPHAALGESFIQNDGWLRATDVSVDAALVEKGLDYGNNGDDPSHLSADAHGAIGSEAWPIVQFTYFVVRHDSLRPGSTCETNRLATMAWLEWFYSSVTASSMLKRLGFAPLPDSARDKMIQLIRDRFKCNGVRVHRAGLLPDSRSEVVPAVAVRIPEELQTAVGLYSAVFASDRTVNITLTINGTAITPPENNGIVVIDERHFSEYTDDPNQVALPFAGIPWGVIYNFCDLTLPVPCDPNTVGKVDLVVTLEVIADILSGRITTFNDSRILSIQENDDQRFAVPNETIKVVISSRASHEIERLLEMLLLRGFDVPQAPEQLPAWFIEQPEMHLAQSFVAATAFSLTISPVSAKWDSSVFKVARMRNVLDGAILRPDEAALTDCFSSGDVAPAWNISGCWSFSEGYFLAIPSRFSDSQCYTKEPQLLVELAAMVVSEVEPLNELGIINIGTQAALRKLEEIACFGRSIIAPLVDPQYLPFGLITFIRVVTALLALMCLALGIWILANRSKIEAQLTFLFETNLGSGMQILAVFPLTVQDGEASVTQAQLDSSCMAAPWLYILGLTLVFAPLLARSWRVRRIFTDPRLRIYTKNDPMIAFQVALFAPIYTILILWTIIDPFHWVRVVSQVDPTNGAVVQTAGMCTSNYVGAWLGPIVGYLGLGLLFGLVLAFSNRKASGQYVLVRNLSLSVLILAEALVMGIPVLLLVNNIPIASFIVKVVFAYFTALSSTLLLFMPVIAAIKGWKFFSTGSSKGQSDVNNNTDGYNGNNTSKNQQGIRSREVVSKDSLRDMHVSASVTGM